MANNGGRQGGGGGGGNGNQMNEHVEFTVKVRSLFTNQRPEVNAPPPYFWKLSVSRDHPVGEVHIRKLKKSTDNGTNEKK